MPMTITIDEDYKEKRNTKKKFQTLYQYAVFKSTRSRTTSDLNTHGKKETFSWCPMGLHWVKQKKMYTHKCKWVVCNLTLTVD